MPAIERTRKYAEDVGIVLLHDHYTEEHLAAVLTEMRTLGTPTLRAVWSDGDECWFALEGCHRLRAAHQLGLMPLIDEVDEDAVISEESGYDLQDAMRAGQIIDSNRNNQELRFPR